MAITLNWGAMEFRLGNSIRGRLVDIRYSRGDSISYYCHGVNGDN